MIELYLLLKKEIPTLELVLNGNEGIVYINKKIVMQTSGPDTVNVLNTFFGGVYAGFVEGFKCAGNLIK